MITSRSTLTSNCHAYAMLLLSPVCMLQVLEETGFDVGSRLRSNDYIEIHLQEKRSRLYIIQGVSASQHESIMSCVQHMLSA